MKRHKLQVLFSGLLLPGFIITQASAQCTWKPKLIDGFEYQTPCTDIVPGTVYTNISQSHAINSGHTSLYLNFVDCGGGTGTSAVGTVYIREMAICPNFEHRISAYCTTSFSGAQCNMNLVVTDANLNVITSTSGLLASYSPAWINYQSVAFTPTTPTIKFIMITNIDGQNGNDLSMDDFLLEDCLYYTIGNDTNLCINNIFTINAGSGFASYLWNTGSINQSISVATQNGVLNAANYMVLVTDSNGCMFSDTIKVTFDPCADLNEIAPLGDYHVEYNQPLEFLALSKAGNKNPNTKFVLTDAAGKTIKIISFGKNGQQTSLAGMYSGIYFYRIEKSNEIVLRGKLFKAPVT